MKTVLCYGDSNTWGQIPLKEFVKKRFPEEVRWTGRLQLLVGRNFKIIEEGNNGRTTGVDDPVREGRNGLTYLQPCIDSHVPLDWVVFMLGTNDLKRKFQPTPNVIADRMQKLVQLTKSICSTLPGLCTQILVISPPIIRPEYYAAGDFDYSEAELYSQELAQYYSEVCSREGAHFLDAGKIIETSALDGAHFDEHNHSQLADAVWAKLIQE